RPFREVRGADLETQWHPPGKGLGEGTGLSLIARSPISQDGDTPPVSLISFHFLRMSAILLRQLGGLDT
ncbi:MAG: hypothetical protein AAF317_20600, partial [Pseudomonadota bacterium]